MNFTRGASFTVQVKSIICMMVYIVALISGMAAKSEPNVQVEMITPVTTQSEYATFELSNNCLKAFKDGVFIDKFERNVDGEWQELQFDWMLNQEDLLHRVWFIDKSILPFEVFRTNIWLDGLFIDGEKPTAGQYRLTFGVTYADGSKTILVPCDFEIEQA